MQQYAASFRTLLTHELLILARARGAWWLAAGIGTLLTAAAIIFGGASGGVDAVGSFAHAIVPMGVAPWAAAACTRPRTRIGSARMYNAPVARTTHFWAITTALVIVAAGSLLASLPFFFALRWQRGVFFPPSA